MKLETASSQLVNGAGISEASPGEAVVIASVFGLSYFSTSQQSHHPLSRRHLFKDWSWLASKRCAALLWPKTAIHDPVGVSCNSL